MFKSRKLILIVSLIILGLILASTVLNAQIITVQTPATVGALPLLWMKETEALGEGIQLEINISPDHNRAIALISKKEIEMMVTGVNVGAKVYNKGIDVQLLNTNIWAIDYLLTAGFKANSWADLKGKSLSLPLQGGPLDFLARYFMQENGVDLAEVKLVYQASNSGVRAFQLGQLDAIILPEPLVTITLGQSEDAHLSLDLQEEWAKLHAGEDRIPYVGLFVRGDFASENQALVEKINHYYQQGVVWVQDNPEQAAQLAAKYFNMPAKIIQASFARINLNVYPREESLPLIASYFQEIMKIYPEMIGGRIPDESFYF